MRKSTLLNRVKGYEHYMGAFEALKYYLLRHSGERNKGTTRWIYLTQENMGFWCGVSTYRIQGWISQMIEAGYLQKRKRKIDEKVWIYEYRCVNLELWM